MKFRFNNISALLLYNYYTNLPLSRVHNTAPFRLIRAASPYMRDASKEEMDKGKTPEPRCIINVCTIRIYIYINTMERRMNFDFNFKFPLQSMLMSAVRYI